MPLIHPSIHHHLSPAEAFLWMPFPYSGSANSYHLKRAVFSITKSGETCICYFCTSEGSASFSWEDGVFKRPYSCESWIGEAKGGSIAIFCYPTNTLVMFVVSTIQSQGQRYLHLQKCHLRIYKSSTSTLIVTRLLERYGPPAVTYWSLGDGKKVFLRSHGGRSVHDSSVGNIHDMQRGVTALYPTCQPI
ncbi:hypothetical protein FPOAC2_11081 [Fusarium poae]|jgi:hypothetical protein